MNALDVFFYELLNVTAFDVISTTIFASVLVLYTIIKINKDIKVNDFKIIDIHVIDNKAQWVYDNKIYYADVINGKINSETTRKIEI
jgi:hypothetical protein